MRTEPQDRYLQKIRGVSYVPVPGDIYNKFQVIVLLLLVLSALGFQKVPFEDSKGA